MIGVDYVQRLARFNRWQNESLYRAADGLGEEERRRERGAFFGSIHKTFSHLVWADLAWMARLAGWAPPAGGITESTSLVGDWSEMKRRRADIDRGIVEWADALQPDALAGDLTYYSFAAGGELTFPRWFLVTHVFNHQSHHRGQIHCLLTQAGVKPGDMDLILMPA